MLFSSACHGGLWVGARGPLVFACGQWWAASGDPVDCCFSHVDRGGPRSGIPWTVVFTRGPWWTVVFEEKTIRFSSKMYGPARSTCETKQRPTESCLAVHRPRVRNNGPWDPRSVHHGPHVKTAAQWSLAWQEATLGNAPASGASGTHARRAGGPEVLFSSACHGGLWVVARGPLIFACGQGWTTSGDPVDRCFSHVDRGGPRSGIPWTVVFHMWTVVGRKF